MGRIFDFELATEALVNDGFNYKSPKVAKYLVR